MLPNRLHELRDPSSWDGKLVHYVPYVGENYSDGLINGVRLLLVGESHYEDAGLPLEESRLFTLNNFGDYVDPSYNPANDKTFFKRVGQLPTLKEDPSPEQVADVWRRIAFTNFLQRSVGKQAADRPTSENWKSGEPALREIVNRLKPDAVLFLSASGWNRV